MKTKILFVYLFLQHLVCIAQKQANYWHFGLGRCLDFTSGSPVNVAGSQIFSVEGSASYADQYGSFLLYTNGGGRELISGQDEGHIWNRNNAVMHNMLGVQGGGFSAKQSSVVVEAPGQDSIYYVFTMDEIEYSIGATPATIAAQPNGRGLSYFTVDMRLNGGLGGVVQVDQRVYTPSAEGLCAVKHANGRDFWIIINRDTTGFAVYSLTPAGVALANAFTFITERSIIKASPDGSRVAAERLIPASGLRCTLFNFDNASGILSSPVNLTSPDIISWEFSPNSRYLYSCERSNPPATNCNIVRYDLQAPSIPASASIIGSVPTLGSDMQLAPDGKIYFLTWEFLAPFNSSINRINCPNTSTAGIQTGLFTYPNGTAPAIGLPNFPAWLFENYDSTFVSLGPDTVRICDVGGSYVLDALNPGATYLWSTGETTQTITVTNPGTYSVTVNGPCGPGSDEMVLLSCNPQQLLCEVFEFTGALQQWTVPSNVDTLFIKMWGAAGGGGPDTIGNWGGGGGFTEAVIPVSAGQVLDIYVGGGGQAANLLTGGSGGWPNGGNGGSGNRVEVIVGQVGGSGGGGGRSEIRISGVSFAIAGGGGGGAYNRAGGYGGGLEAEYTIASNAFNIHGFGGTQLAGGQPASNTICGHPVSGTAGSALQGGTGATDLGGTSNDRTGGGGGGDGFFGGGGGSSHDGCFGVGSAGGGGSGYLCSTCPGVTGLTLTQTNFAAPGSPANETDPLLASYPGVATGTNSANGGNGIIQICFAGSPCIPTTTNILANACSNYTAPWGVTFNQTGTYLDTIVNSAGCDSIIQLNLTITGLPALTISSGSGTCGQPNGTATASATGGAGNYAYTWSNGATGSFITGLSSGSYSVIATDQNGCSSTSQVVLSTSPAAGVTLIASDTILGVNETAVLEILGGDTYSWTPSTGLNCDDCFSVIASPSSSTTYTVTGTDSSGCPYIRVINVLIDIVCSELFVPDIFSPNGQGNAENEKLCVYSNCIKSMNLGIYNRWGELIFSTDNQNACWDGTHKGEPVMTGVYSYRLFVEQFDGEKIERTGNITLKR
jgi:gliding motility-associated-like protein